MIAIAQRLALRDRFPNETKAGELIVKENVIFIGKSKEHRIFNGVGMLVNNISKELNRVYRKNMLEV